MSALNELFSRLKNYTHQAAFVFNDKVYTYQQFQCYLEEAQKEIEAHSIKNKVVSLQADYSPKAIAWLLILWKEKNIVALLSNKTVEQKTALTALCEASLSISIQVEKVEIKKEGDKKIKNTLINQLLHHQQAGFIIFSSGSTGQPKAILHRAEPFLEQHLHGKKGLRTLAFLLLDHIGGLNVLFCALFKGSCLVITEDRKPFTVAKLIEKHQIQAVTTSPTFLNLLLFSGVFEQYNLTSLGVINYGTEPMPESTLTALRQHLPQTRFSQAYGLSEVGIIPTRSQNSDSLWMKIGSEQCPVRLRDGIVEVKSPASMVGYLNAESNLTEDGWFITQDLAVQEGEYMRILGRQSDLMNIGGEKVYPVEIENCLKTMPHVVDVSVYAESHPLVGNIMIGHFQLNTDKSLLEFKKELQSFCKNRLLPFQIPQKVLLTREGLHNERFKKMRRNLYTKQLSFRQGVSEAGEGVYNKYMTEADAAYNAAEDSSAKCILRS